MGTLPSLVRAGVIAGALRCHFSLNPLRNFCFTWLCFQKKPGSQQARSFLWSEQGGKIIENIDPGVPGRDRGALCVPLRITSLGARDECCSPGGKQAFLLTLMQSHFSHPNNPCSRQQRATGAGKPLLERSCSPCVLIGTVWASTELHLKMLWNITDTRYIQCNC